MGSVTAIRNRPDQGDEVGPTVVVDVADRQPLRRVAGARSRGLADRNDHRGSEGSIAVTAEDFYSRWGRRRRLRLAGLDRNARRDSDVELSVAIEISDRRPSNCRLSCGRAVDWR